MNGTLNQGSGHAYARRSQLRAVLGVAIFAIGTSSLHSVALADPVTDCAELKQLSILNVVVLDAEHVPAGAFKEPDNGKAHPELNAFCRFVGSARPSAGSDIRFEVWLPEKAWNGRLWATGGRNFDGEINYFRLSRLLAEGYVTTTTNSGHWSKDTLGSDWARGHPQLVIDFGYRAAHETAVAAKRVTEAFYRRRPTHSYYSSCSQGGREGLMEAQRYPDDYDGILVGAPAYDLTHVNTSMAMIQFQWLADPSHQISAEKLKAVQDAVVSACEGADGVKDGVLQDPQSCQLPREALTCKEGDSPRCLTTGQLATINLLHSGPALSSGTRLYPGYAMGSEELLSDDTFFNPDITQNDGYLFGNGFFRDFVFEDPAWDYRTFDADRDGRRADEKLAAIVNATDPNLSSFAKHGGKLIIYHGWGDPVLSPLSTLDYYRKVVGVVGEATAHRSVRLFMAPGVGHCYFGPGPNEFGQFSGGTGDPDSSLGAALQRWVERGVAPERVIARKRADDMDFDFKGPVVKTRPICAWPLVAHYRGKGRIESASSFTCRPAL